MEFLLPELVNVERPGYSFFNLAAKYAPNQPRPFQRILSLLRQVNVKRMFQVGADEQTLHKYYFFNEAYPSISDIPDGAGSLVGYVELEKVSTISGVRWIVRKSLVHLKQKQDHYICGYSDHEVVAQEVKKRWRITTASHVQQDQVEGCCAHAAISTAVEAMGKSVAPKIADARTINSLLGIDPRGRQVTAGLNVDEIEIALQKLDFKPIRFTATKPEHSSLFLQTIYNGIESGFPVILGFSPIAQEPIEGQEQKPQATGHVLTVVGHVFDPNHWFSESARDHSWNAGYNGSEGGCIQSLSWTSSLIVHDDNSGPFFTIPLHYLEQNIATGTFEFTAIMVTDLNDNLLNWYANKERANHHFRHMLPKLIEGGFKSQWTVRLNEANLKSKTTVRTTLSTRDEYLKHLVESGVKIVADDPHSVLAAIKDYLPDRFWLNEFSIPEIYTANRSRIADMILDIESGNPKLVRMPEAILLFEAKDIKSRKPPLILEVDEQTYTPLKALPRYLGI